MRDIAITLCILGFIPFILRYPWIGVLVYAWISIFSPHRYAYGFAYDFPFAMLIGVVTAVSLLVQLREVRLPINAITILLMLLPLWMTVTLLFALVPNEAYVRWKEVMKTFVFILVAASLLHSRKQLEIFLWVIVLSIGFYGIKGGIFTLLLGGGLRVYGPPGDSYISDNTAIAAALIMVVPLMHFLSNTLSSKWMKLGMYGAMFLSGMAILGTQSRGALLGIIMMVVFLWFKSSNKVLSGAALLLIGVFALSFMPEKWMNRMDSIGEYKQDASAQGRLNSWGMAINLANDRPLVGGGFEPYVPKTFARYAPDPDDLHSAHSIYFQMLGEHGYVGLALFLALGIASWMTARRTIRASQDRPDHAWEGNLARAIQVSLIGYATAGAFINISYWDFVYYEIVILMASSRLVQAAEGKSDPDALESRANVSVT